ncbi:MAG: 50S ribosomal protein L29 [Parcubacteria group bacterium]|nr:50S ribosomal protein L29 [Parcubacteria group bacterium]
MKTQELREKSENEIKKLLAEKREGLRDLRFKVSQRQLKNIREVRKVKKSIARFLTILKEKESKE